MALSHQSIASKNVLPFQSTLNEQQQPQHQHIQSYPSAASIFASIEENVVKNVLHIIGVQQNDNNIMTATICNVIDTVTANTYNMFNKKVNHLADRINNNNNIMLNHINDIIDKNNKNLIHHINELMNKTVKKIDGMNIKIMSEEEEKESLVEILLNDIDIIKSSLKHHQESDNNKSEAIKKLFQSKLEPIQLKLNEINNNIKQMERNIDKKNKTMMDDTDNKLKKMEININEKLKSNHSSEVKKLDEINLNISNQVNGFKNLKNSLNENINNKLKKIEKNLGGKAYPSSNKMSKKLEEIKNEINQLVDIKKLDEMNSNILIIKNEFEASAISNAVALQRINKKMTDIKFGEYDKSKEKELPSSSATPPTLSTNYKNNKNNNKNNNNNNKCDQLSKYQNINNYRNKKGSSPSTVAPSIQTEPEPKLYALNNKRSISSTPSILRTDNNNNRKGIELIIVRNNELYGGSKQNENAMEFYINCDRRKSGCVIGNLWQINIKNDGYCGHCNVYIILKINDSLTKKYLIPDYHSRSRLSHIEDYLVYHYPMDERKKYKMDINNIEINGKPIDGDIRLDMLYRSH